MRVHTGLPELREESGRTGAVGENSQRPEGIFGAQSKHGTEGVGIDTNSTKLAQQNFERPLVGHAYLVIEVIRVGGLAP
jgi:hypothetical protein